MRPVQQQFLRGVASGAIIVIAIIVIATMLSRAIERPVAALSRAAESAAGGTFESVTAEGPREIASSRMRSTPCSPAGWLRRRSGRLSPSDCCSSRKRNARRIARELHDDLGQALTALKMDVAAW